MVSDVLPPLAPSALFVLDSVMISIAPKSTSSGDAVPSITAATDVIKVTTERNNVRGTTEKRRIVDFVWMNTLN